MTSLSTLALEYRVEVRLRAGWAVLDDLADQTVVAKEKRLDYARCQLGHWLDPTVNPDAPNQEIRLARRRVSPWEAV